MVQHRGATGSMTCPPHHWLIALPKGPTSKGRCKRCEEVRYFSNAAGERVTTRKCNRCRETKPLTLEHFMSYGLSIRLHYRCRECESGVAV